MKKYCQSLLILVCVLVLTVSLCGCALLEKAFGGVPTQPTQENTEPVQVEGGYLYELPDDTTFHSLPGNESTVVTSHKKGDSVIYRVIVEYEGAIWASSDDGWFIIESDLESYSQNALNRLSYYLSSYYEVDDDILVTETAPAYAEPSGDSAVIGQVQIGTVEHVTKRVLSNGGYWFLLDAGWVSEEYLWVLMSNANRALGIIRSENAYLYEQADISSQVVGTTTYLSYLNLYNIELTIDGVQWFYADEGWIQRADIYIFGETGEGACTIRITANTPVNTYQYPNTESTVITTLPVGIDAVWEQFEYNGTIWGVNAYGWILMETVEILE